MLFLVFALSSGYADEPDEPDEIDREIMRLKKEISRVQSQRKEEKKQADRERRELEAYRKRTADKIAAVKHVTDSIKNSLEQAGSRNDSIKMEISSIQVHLREVELNRDNLKKEILNSVKEILRTAEMLPPLIQQQYAGPLSYLSGEIEAGTVESTEALFRLMRIVQDLRTVAQEIQVVEGASPVEELRGSVYRLRIGAVWEAAVDGEGKNAFIWTGYSDTSGVAVWRKPASVEYTASILDAVRMREGKTVPELITLPMEVITAAEGGQNEK